MAVTSPSPPPYQGSDTNVIASIAIPDAVILLLGFGLISVSQWKESIQPVWDLIANGKVPSQSSNALALLGGEIAFVFILAMLADISDGMSQLVFAFLFALWMLWAIKNPDELKAIVKLPKQGVVPGVPGIQP